MMKFILGFLVGILGFLLVQEHVQAADLKIIDSSGLIRAVRIVKDSSTVRISLVDSPGARGECVATNVDGIASERREQISPKGECIFKSLAAGTWQVAVSGGVRWRVHINE
jgi:hypothetical protein